MPRKDYPTIYRDQEDEMDDLVFHRSRVPNVQQRHDYLFFLEEGFDHVTAARKVGSTGSAFSSLRKNDAGFARQVREIMEYHGDAEASRLRFSANAIANNPDHPKHFEAVRWRSEALLPEFEYKRNRRTELRTPDGLQLEHGAMLDYSRYTDEELAQLRELHEKGRPGERRALSP